MAGYLWRHEETKVLPGLWWNASLQEELKGAKRSKTAFLKVAKDMNEAGCEWTRQQCGVKPKNIISNYRKIAKSSKMHAKRIELFSSSTLFAFFAANDSCAHQRSM